MTLRHTVWLTSLGAALCAGPSCPQDLALRGATILTMAGDPIENGTLLVRDGKIAAVGANVDLPAGVQTLGLTGRTIMPGMIDGNAWEGFRGRQVEESREVLPSYRVARSVDPDSPQLRQLAQRGTTAVCLSPGHRAVIGGLCAVLKTAGESREAMVVKDDAGLQATIGRGPASGNRSIRGAKPNTFYYRRPTTRMGGVWLLRKAFFSVTEAPTVPPDPADAEVLRAVLAGRMPLRITTARMIDIETAYRVADEFGIRNVVLEEAFEAHKLADEIARRGTPLILSNLFYQSGDQRRIPKLHLNNAGILAEAGAKFCFGTALSDGRPDLRTCAIMAHRYGLPRDESLKALTVNAAEILGVADRLGSLEPGKDADFLVLSGDPLSLLTRIESVYVNGRLVYRAE